MLATADVQEEGAQRLSATAPLEMYMPTFYVECIKLALLGNDPRPDTLSSILPSYKGGEFVWSGFGLTTEMLTIMKVSNAMPQAGSFLPSFQDTLLRLRIIDLTTCSPATAVANHHSQETLDCRKI